jgi:nucleotide-binding universal stress UspA family protein
MAEPIRSIVAAVDFGEASARAVRVAGLIARRFGATLRLVHAETIEAPPYFTPEQVETLEAQRQQMRAQAGRHLVGFGRAQTDAPFEAVVSSHAPVDAILADSAGADLVVMGTHGRRGPARWWLGSVAERVLRETDRPLLVVRGGDDPPERLTDRVEVHAFETAGGSTLAWAEAFVRPSGGDVVDRRRDVARAPDEGAGTTLVAYAVPEPRTSRWLATHAEPWLRASHVPVVFVPDEAGGKP